MCIHCYNGDFDRDAKRMAVVYPVLILAFVVWAVFS